MVLGLRNVVSPDIMHALLKIGSFVSNRVDINTSNFLAEEKPWSQENFT
jgi:hypothetical protein